MIKTLFGKDSKGNIKTWAVVVDGDTIKISHGRLGGKMQVKTTVCTPKNIGRANETSGEAQALLEAEAKYKKQLDKLYRPTVGELSEVGNDLPMLAHDYTKVGHRMEYPLYVSRKLDGVRCLATVNGTEVKLTSRGGKEYQCPEGVYHDLVLLSNITGFTTFDGELYSHGMPLPMIISAVKKPSALTDNLLFEIFDIPSAKSWSYRLKDLCNLYQYKDLLTHTGFVDNYLVKSEDEVRPFLEQFMNEGFEGVMLRSMHGLYQFNHRSSDLMKWKEFQDTEVKVEFVEEDKNKEGVLNCIMKDGKTRVKCKMRGNHEFRSYENQKKLLGSWITLRYQQLTPDGVPQFPVGICVRDCDSKGNPTI